MNAIQKVVSEARRGGLTLREVEREVKREWVMQTLIEHKFNKCRTARALNIHRNTMLRVMARLAIPKKPVASETNQQTSNGSATGA